ncbi:phage tail sheath subtilisin-like domain-containing protein [Clostridium chrysemydis]|uniref:phage tail sheath subtilisin-like domain-containing protein n=1 Tax=Clostridium chrysemydis TaxID=2665504 RepID=UPI001883C067|nr:phage tail sheath subtilisin-like domain-containing protein [Clostridium chrysemydis]
MSFPKINITFKGLAGSAVTRSANGIVALILKGESRFHVLESLADMPEELTAVQKEAVEMAFNGASKVIVSVEDAVAKSLKRLETVRFNYLAAPEGETDDNTAIASWIKLQRENKSKRVKAVLANTAADNEGIINFTTNGIKVKDREEAYSAQMFTARIAGLIAGTGARDSVTFARLPEVEDIAAHLTEEEAASKISAGELVLFHDGDKVKVARGVNSLVTVTGDKNEAFKKIKLVEIMDMIHDDIKRTAEDDFIGKIRNTYPNKLLLCNAINAYFEALEAEEVLEANQNKCEIDEVATRAYLKETGVDVSLLKPAEIKSANTGDKVFISAKISMIDAMEIIDFVIAI